MLEFWFNLQEDLEMSDSDDEGNIMVPLKSPELSELAPCPKSPMNEETDVKAPIPAAAMSMGATEKSDCLVEDDRVRDPSANSSSSESSDSDSEDSCSESNDSESSSEASELEISTKPAAEKWGLSNFIIESQRNHSPGLALDNNTNSSCIAVKDEPPPSVIPDKDDFSIADEDSVNCLLSSKYSDRGINFQSPSDDFFIENPIGIKSGIVSPIPSPVASPVPPPSAPIPRGPRTPPFPPDDDDEDDEPVVERRKEAKRDASDMEVEEPVTSRSKSQANKNSPLKSEKSSTKSRLGDDRHSRSKKKPAPKETPSLKAKGDRRKESSASREPPADTSKDAVSRSVPSAVVSRATHRSPLKPPHKHAKRDSSQTESNNKTFPENKNELSVKSKTASRHSEQLEDAPSSSRGNSRVSSATRSSEVNSAPVKVETEKPELRGGKHSQRSKESHKPSSGQKMKNSSAKSFSKSKSKSDSRPPASESKKPSEKRKKPSKFSIRNFLQEPEQSSSNLNEPSPKVTSGRSSPRLLDSPDVSPKRVVEDVDDDSDDSIVHASRSAARSSIREINRCKSSSSSSSRSRSRSGSRSSKQLENRNRISSGAAKRPSSRSSDKKKKHRVIARSTPETDINPDNSKAHLPSQSSPAPPPISQMLSPIRSVKTESALPTPPLSLMVSIPLSKLLRIPGGKSWNAEIPPKSAQENISQHPSEQRASTSLAVSPSKKDIKAKHRTDSAKSAVSSSSGDKGLKPAKSESISLKVTSPAIIEKSSIESNDHISKSSKVVDGQPATKKRKSDKSETDHVKKKARISSSQMSPKTSDSLQLKLREKTPVVKIERMVNVEICAQSEKGTPPKRLERRDSTSSLSSLSSQKSSKVSKELLKTVSKDGEKKVKVVKPMVLLTSSEIKKEKADKPKICVKKELGAVVKSEKVKSRLKEKLFSKAEIASDSMKLPVVMPGDGLNPSSQLNYWVSKIDDIKPQPTNHQRLPLVDYSAHQDGNSDWERFAPDIQQELKGLPSHINSRINEPGPMAYYFGEGKKLKNMAVKETDPIQQALKYFEATVMFILTSHQREISNKDPESIYQMYKETLVFSNVIRTGIQKHQAHSVAGNIDFKILILCLKCQSLLHLKLYSLKIKEVKEQHKGVTDFMHSSSSRMGSHSSPQPTGSSSHSRNLSQPSPCQPRVGAGLGSVPSPHSPTPSPAGSVASVGSQSSGYSSSEVNGNNPSRPHSSLQLPHMLPHGTVTVPQNMFDIMAKHHTHLSNLHMCHELWEQADMYMTRSNSKDFFNQVAEKSEKLSLHSNIKDLVSYLQKGLELMKDC